MPNMTVTTGAVFIPEIWSQKVNKATESNLVLAPLVMDVSRDVMKSGDTIHIPFISNLVANNKVAGTKVQFQAPTETQVDLLVDQHKESSFLVEDILAAQADYNIMSLYTDKAGFAIAKALDTSIAALASGFSTTFGTFNTAITTDVILDSIEALDFADVPVSDRHFAYQPDVKRDLLDLSTYTSHDFIDGRPVTTGNVGSLYGVDTWMSTNILKSGNNTSNMLFQRDALAMAKQQSPRVQTEYSLEDLGHQVVADILYGVIENRDDFGVLVKT